VLWYIQGEYNSSTTLTINGVAPNTTRWTGPIAASVFQDIRSDNWNGSSPPSFSNPATWGTTGYYISRTDGTAILNNLGARGTLQSGSSPAISGSTMTGSGAVVNSSGTFALGNPTTNISFNGTQMTLNGNIVATQNINPNALSFTASGTSSTSGANVTVSMDAGDKIIVLSTIGISPLYFPNYNNPATYTRVAAFSVNGTIVNSFTYLALIPDLSGSSYPTATINTEFTAPSTSSYNFAITFSGGGTTASSTFIVVIGLKR
jgi:hypothetical protein